MIDAQKLKGRYPKGSNPSNRKGSALATYIEVELNAKVDEDCRRLRLNRSQWFRAAIYAKLGIELVAYEKHWFDTRKPSPSGLRLRGK